jgi:hypothetical protein
MYKKNRKGEEGEKVLKEGLKKRKSTDFLSKSMLFGRLAS